MFDCPLNLYIHDFKIIMCEQYFYVTFEMIMLLNLQIKNNTLLFSAAKLANYIWL